jgi:hypothetical protein
LRYISQIETVFLFCENSNSGKNNWKVYFNC